MTTKMIIGLNLATWIIAAYLGIMGYMYVFQRNYTFQPSGNPFSGDYAPFRPFTYKTPAGLTLRGLRFDAQNGKPTIVYFQGNAGNIADRFHKTKHFLNKGYGFVLVGYRGYSGNPGQPSEQGFYEDARTVIHLLEKEGIPLSNIIIYGESLGTGVATQMAVEFPQARALILEAPFTSAEDIAKRSYWYLPVHKLMKDRFESVKKIGKVTMPVMIMHGTDDQTVPFEYGQKLFSRVTASTKEFVTLKGANHADVYDFDAGRLINEFLDKI